MSEPWTPGPWELQGPDQWNAVPWVTGVDPSTLNEVIMPQSTADARLIAAAPEMAAFIAQVAAREMPGGLDLDATDILQRIRGKA